MREINSDALKKVLLEDLIRRIREGETTIKDGEEWLNPASPQVLNAAISYLKQFPPRSDDPEAEELSETLQNYQDKMPFAKR